MGGAEKGAMIKKTRSFRKSGDEAPVTAGILKK